MTLDVDATAASGVWVRHMPAGGDPLYRPAVAGDGRWQHGEVVEGFYLADSPETAWAEWYRGLAELAVRPMYQMPRDLWRYRVDASRLADLSDAGRLARLGLPVLLPDRRQWAGFQEVGQALHAEGWAGVFIRRPPARKGAWRSACSKAGLTLR